MRRRVHVHEEADGEVEGQNLLALAVTLADTVLRVTSCLTRGSPALSSRAVLYGRV